MDDQILWFNFGDYGEPGLVPISVFESKIMLQAAEDIFQKHSRAACDFMIARKRSELIHESSVGMVDDHWVSRALLLTALQGLMGYEIPEIHTF